jgi:hypothetical protein
MALNVAWADTRIALVIGNSHYLNTPALDNPGNDATDVAGALSAVGFKVTLRLDASKRQFDQALAQFSRDAKAADAALFYYAGHGMQFQGRNLLMPVDAELRDEVSLRYEMTGVDEVKEALKTSKGVKILVLDSCRDNPLANQLVRSISVSTRDVPHVQGFARDERTNGMVIVYSTQADEVAHDGSGRNSPFSAAFVKELKQPGLEVGALFRRVESDVFQDTAGLQSPELSISMVPEFFMNQSETDQSLWARVRANPDAASLRAFLARYPGSFYAPDAAARLDLIESQTRKEAEAEAEKAAARTASEAAAKLKAKQDDLDKTAESAKGREQDFAARLAAAEAEKARLGEELAKSAQERASAEEQARRQAADGERARVGRETALRAEIERLQAGDAEKERLLQKALDEDRARVAEQQQAAGAAQADVKTAADAKAKADGEKVQELQRRIAELEGKVAEARNESEHETQQAADGRKAAQPAQQQVALASPAASAPTDAPSAVAATATAMIPQIRDQLRRLGCFAGGDLNWDSRAMRLGVAKYVRYANLANAAPSPDQSLLDDMKARHAGLCPRECSAREALVGGQCVVKTCPAGATLTRSGHCSRPPPPVQHEAIATRSARPAPAEAPAAEPRPHSHASGANHCFSFNGNQYCE